jgi:plasmid maintenance system antidote protein VapI
MPKTSPLAVVKEQLDTLSLAELLEVQARVAALIEGKSSVESHNPLQLKTDGDDSLEQVINLVDEWMNDESGYDKETYPQIETALNQNRVSI